LSTTLQLFSFVVVVVVVIEENTLLRDESRTEVGTLQIICRTKINEMSNFNS
jgi:hypothetical protein